MELFQQQRQRVEPAGVTGGASLDCIDCGEGIPTDRLRAMPRTKRYYACAAEVEGRWNR